MASTFGILLILLGGFVMVIGYQMLSDCLIRSFNSPCWSPRAPGALGLYVGAALAISGTIILVGPDVAKIMRKFKDPGRDS